MKSSVARDEQTVTITTTLALVIAVMMGGVALLWLLSMATGLSSQDQSRIFIATFVVAVAISGRYLLRHRRS